MENKEFKKVYLAIPYSQIDKDSSYRQANEATCLIINDGYNVFSPITHSHPLTKCKAELRGDWEFWQHIDYQFLDWSDEMWVLIPEEGKEPVLKSIGVNAEIKYAEDKNIPIRYVKVENDKIVEYERQY